MAPRNQNRPPRSPSPKKDGMDQVPVDKRRKIGAVRMGGPPATGRKRQVFSVVSNKQDLVVGSDAGISEGSECGNVEFTKEEVDVLLNEKFKGKKFDIKGKLEQVTEHSKRLKVCIKWFQQAHESHLLEEEKLRHALESADKKCSETELEMRKRRQEFTSSISEMQKTIASMEEKIATEESDKLVVLECHRREKEARLGAEKLQDSLSGLLEKSLKDRKPPLNS